MAELVKYDTSSADSRVFLRANGVDFLSKFTANTFTRSGEDLARFVSTPIGLFDITVPLDEIEYDGNTGLTESELIELINRNA